ncbi:MAG: hypothetical protein CMM94_05800 [Rickettsiales bacterium]|nr:hypothetical protein [Rickettsiales bacterium]|tara:strand:+ start:713 stop:940 length:228 start_codon:yes stop_codon:yes gene_type:complete
MFTSDTDTTDTYEISDLVMSMVGVEYMAYIKPVLHEGEDGFAVFAADGTQLAVFDSHEAAYFTAKQHNLEPVNLH